MRKIISLYMRNYDGDHLVRDEVTPGAEWVIAGEGVATRKWDGTCCMVRDGKLYKRYDAKHGKTPPPDFEAAQPEPDEKTGHWPGWVPVGDGPQDAFHREAWAAEPSHLSDGTYELIGPKIGGNPEHSPRHVLVPHGTRLVNAPRTFDALREFFKTADIEGVVWWHPEPDGTFALVKIKAKDFGLTRTP